ncbi:hypothetical protein L293_1216 [Acinetobacter gyllenbergii CIP 110306 = MTCC 11365]|nr:hypothetical protein L293_1216 [Acinetobacter gyllenbergii CIP 110306 = MTCC 11365]
MSLKKARELALELKYKYSKSVLREEIKPFFKDKGISILKHKQK